MNEEVLSGDGSNLSGGNDTSYVVGYDSGDQDSSDNVYLGSSSTDDSFSLLLEEDFNISGYAYTGMTICGIGCLLSIAVITFLGLLRK